MPGSGTLAQSAINYDMAVSHACNLTHLVAHEHYGGVALQIGDYAVEMLLEMLVEITQRLVEHEHIGTADNRTAEECALKLTARQPTDRSPGKV